MTAAEALACGAVRSENHARLIESTAVAIGVDPVNADSLRTIVARAEAQP